MKGRYSETKWENDSALVCSNHVTSPFSAWKYARTEMVADSISVLKYQSVWPSKCSHISKKKILSHYSLNQPPTPLQFMFIFINPVRHKTSLMLKPILSQSCGSEWNVCSAGVLSVCSQLWWNKNQCAHTIGQKGRYWWLSHLFRRLFLSAWRTMQPIGFKQIQIVIAISTCVVDGSFDLSTDIVLWDWSNAFISPAPITYQGNRIWDRGRKVDGGVSVWGNENKSSMLPWTPAAGQIHG